MLPVSGVIYKAYLFLPVYIPVEANVSTAVDYITTWLLVINEFMSNNLLKFSEHRADLLTVSSKTKLDVLSNVGKLAHLIKLEVTSLGVILYPKQTFPELQVPYQ